MSDQGPEPPWIDAAPPPPVPDPPAPAVGGQAALRREPIAPQGAPESPLRAIERLANWSLALSIASLLCGGIFFSIPALILASRAQRKARPYGKTSSDGRIRAARTLAIVAIAVWVFILVVYAISASSSNSS
jgi:hypothetical protein